MKTVVLRRLTPALLAALAAAAGAQPHTGGKAHPLDAQAAVPPLTFASALAGYQPYAEQPVGSWKDANETVHRIGGWRTYAREARQPEPASRPAPSPDAVRAQPAPHGGHATH